MVLILQVTQTPLLLEMDLTNELLQKIPLGMNGLIMQTTLYLNCIAL